MNTIPCACPTGPPNEGGTRVAGEFRGYRGDCEAAGSGAREANSGIRNAEISVQLRYN